MVSHAQGDSKKIAEIHSKQLIGIEYQSDLSFAEIYIHQYEKTNINIINGDCFDENVLEQIKQQKSTIGFLNPPYKSDKKQDIDAPFGSHFK